MAKVPENTQGKVAAVADTPLHISGRRKLFEDYLTVEAAEVDIPRGDGTTTGAHRLLRVDRRDAAAVLIIDRAAESLVLVEQFRWATYDKGPGWILEIVAGVIDAGEAAEATARRETLEEAGVEIGALTPIATCYPTPGYSTERCFIFAAEADGAAAGMGQEIGGADRHEATRKAAIPFAEITDRLASGKLQDAKTVIALQWFLLLGLRGED